MADDVKLAIIEVGAGTTIPTMRCMSAMLIAAIFLALLTTPRAWRIFARIMALALVSFSVMVFL